MRLTNLQALRTIGAATVVVCHARHYALTELSITSPFLDWVFAYLAGPALSVFFAISGYVLMHMIEAGSTDRFVLNRLLRVFPTYWVAIGIAILLLKLQRMPFIADVRLIPSMLLLPVGEGNGYYVLGVEWTLIFEIVFYLWLGLMLALNRRHGPTVGAVCWLAVIVGAMFVRDPGPFQPLPRWQEVLLSPFAAPFLLGALSIKLRRFGKTLCLMAPVAAPGLILLARLIPRWDVSTLVMGIGGALLVAWAAAARQISAERSIVVFGDYSYGVYLLHMPLLATVFRLSMRRHWAHPSLDLVAFGVFVAIGLGLCFGYCEMAMYRRLRRALFSRRDVPREPHVINIDTARAARAA